VSGCGGDGRADRGRPRAEYSGGARLGGEQWSRERAESHLRSLELFGMRFGLDRMRRMMTALGSPERRFRTVHVVGTNGKTSTTRMTAAILQRHGVRTGAYTSPHLVSYAERVQVGERDLSSSAFAAAVARAAKAAERVNHTLAADDHVTQFELLTAAAFSALAERGVEAAVVEAGLGGRYDATAVVDANVTVLTNIGLEHTRILGPTVADIAAEKLAVLRPGGTLAVGADLDPEALSLARAAAVEQGARIVEVSAGDVAAAPPAVAFQRRNFALARAAAEAYLGSEGIVVDEEAVQAAARETVVRGRIQVVAEDPPTVLDGAHNPDAAKALAESLVEFFQGFGGRWSAGGKSRPQLALVMGVLDDKDAAAMLAALLPLCERAWFTAPPSSRALSPAALRSLARQRGFDEAECEPNPRRALGLAQEWARAQSPGGTVLATGSIYLVGDLLAGLAERDAAEAGAAGGNPAGSGAVRARLARGDAARRRP
jgi:dihydrofolate synthase / folylpolyglutamate synthase